MPYSPRQLRCLEAMGIVPWIPRQLVEGMPADPVHSATAVCVEAIRQPPHDMTDFASWLERRALDDIRYRGSLQRCIGPPEAPLLIVVEHAGHVAEKQPLTGDAAQLFELMLRSIKLGSRDVRQCMVAADTAVDTPAQSAGGACNSHTRAVLVLLDNWAFDTTDTGVERHQGRLLCPDTGLEIPLWRIAHPIRLLEQPQLKRQSWQVLKAVHAELAGYSAP